MASKLSRDLCNIAVQLRSGLTRGSKPRELTADEINALNRRRDSIRDQIIEARKQRISARVNEHTTAESNRVIAASANHSQSVISEVTAAVDAAKSEILCAQAKAKQRSASGKRVHGRLLGATVVAAQPDSEMGDSTFKICHVEAQTWADGEKHTVCIVKAEGKPSLSRELSTLTIHDPFISRDAAQAVRVVVIPHDVEHAQFHVGWRGIVQAATASAPSVKVDFPLLKMGKIVHASMMVPRTSLRILGDDDVSMLPNTHPWLGRRVTTVQGGQAGEIVDVSNKGRVKIALEGPEKKKAAIFVESKGSSFESLFTVEPRAKEEEQAAAVPDQPQATEAQPQAAPSQPLAADVQLLVASREDARLADSDAESVQPAGGSDDESSDEESKPAPKRRAINPAKAVVVKTPAAGGEDSKPVAKKRTGKQPTRATGVKRPAASNAEDPKPAPKRKGKQPAKVAPKRRRMSSVDVD